MFEETDVTGFNSLQKELIFFEIYFCGTLKKVIRVPNNGSGFFFQGFIDLSL